MTATDRVHSPTPEELMAFLDGETPLDGQAAIETHIAGCPECRGTISELRGVSRALSVWEPESAPVTIRAPRARSAKGWSLPAFSWRPGYVTLSLTGATFTALLVVGASQVRRTPTAAEPQTVAADSITVADGALNKDGARNGRLDSNAPVANDVFRAAPSGGLATVPGAAKTESRTFARAAGIQSQTTAGTATAPRQPSVIRTATLQMVATDFNAARASVEGIVVQTGGFLDQITVNGGPGSARTLTGTLRVPAVRLGEALAKLRQLGQVTVDTQGSEDVTDQLVDLDARLANARATEQRLTDILKNRTGKLSDVLEVEQEISRVRLQIEQMDAERQNTGRRVAYATVTLQIDEVRKAGLESGPLSLPTRLRVAAADGLEAALESIVSAVLFVLRAGPAASLWILLAALSWLVVRRFRRSPSA